MPVERSQVFTTPASSLEIAIPSFVCRLTDWIGDKICGRDPESVVVWFFDDVPICQNLTDPSVDAEIRERGEENARAVISLMWPTKVSIRQ